MVAPKRAPASWPRVTRRPQWTPTCRRRLGYGRRCRTLAAEPGVDAFSMWKLSNVDWRRPRNQVSHDLLLDDQVMPNILAVAESNSKYKLPGVVPAGFWVGLWHGIIAPLLFWVSLLVPGVRIYETNNK